MRQTAHGLQDGFAYCGTSTGDVLQVNMANKLFNNIGPKARSKRENFSEGVLASAITPFSDVLVGAGDGTISLLKHDLQVKCQVRSAGANWDSSMQAPSFPFASAAGLDPLQCPPPCV